jgi:hypothetical protein
MLYANNHSIFNGIDWVSMLGVHVDPCVAREVAVRFSSLKTKSSGVKIDRNTRTIL